MIVEWEVSVGVGVAPTGSNVRRVEDVGVDQLDFGADAIVPIVVTLLDVLAPEVGTFEELGAFWDLAPEFVNVFLSDELKSVLVVIGMSGEMTGLPC